jgi:hypothetical protein
MQIVLEGLFFKESVVKICCSVNVLAPPSLQVLLEKFLDIHLMLSRPMEVRGLITGGRFPN